jgi:hypothetical protein
MKQQFIVIFLLLASSFSFATTYHVSQQHPKASDQNNGSFKKPFKTINRAAALALPGDTVLVHSGIYREWVAPVNSGKPGKYIVYKAAIWEEVVLKGSEIWNNSWQNVKKHLFKSKLPLEKLKDYNPFYIPARRMEGRLSLGQIFVDGHRYQQVDSLREVEQFPGTWMLGYDSLEIILHYDPKNQNKTFAQSEVEFTVRERVFSPHQRGLGYIAVEGFQIEHAANQFPSGFYHLKGSPQVGALSTRAGHHWIIRNNRIRFAKTLAIDCGYGGHLDLEDPENPWPPYDSIGYHLIENNLISDCGAGGIAGAHQRETIIRNNTIERTNYMNFTAPETGGIKVHFFYDGLIEGNILQDNNCNGIWVDNVWYGTRITRNLILHARGHGIFVEMGYGPCLVDNNVIAYTKIGEGIYLHDASGVTMANNLLYANQHFGIFARIVTERKPINYLGEREVVATKELTIVNNVFVDNYRGHMNLPLEDGYKVRDNRSDYNLFINGVQWQWAGLEHHSFTIGASGGRIKNDSLPGALKKAMDDHDYPEDLRPNFSLWKKQPLLRYDWWKMLTGNDKNSLASGVESGAIEDGAIAKGAMSLSDRNLFFDISNGTLFRQLKCPAVEGVNHDFYGNPVHSDTVYPGPFQNYQQGFNRFVLIPPARNGEGKLGENY